MADADRKVLEIFNEKAEKLDRYSFTRFFREGNLGYSYREDDRGGGEFSFSGPSEESTDAFALTIRMFLQNNDLLGIANLDSLYQRLPISATLKAQFSEARSRLNAQLDGSSNVVVRGESLSNRTILNAFLYGLLAHTSLRERETIDGWAKDSIQFQLLQMVFFGILADILEFVFWTHEHNRFAMAELDA